MPDEVPKISSDPSAELQTRRSIIDRTTTALNLFNERGGARDLAAFNSAGEGASLLDHDADFAGEAAGGCERLTLAACLNLSNDSTG